MDQETRFELLTDEFEFSFLESEEFKTTCILQLADLISRVAPSHPQSQELRDISSDGHTEEGKPRNHRITHDYTSDPSGASADRWWIEPRVLGNVRDLNSSSQPIEKMDYPARDATRSSNIGTPRRQNGTNLAPLRRFGRLYCSGPELGRLESGLALSELVEALLVQLSAILKR